jgi:hypothetical protein
MVALKEKLRFGYQSREEYRMIPQKHVLLYPENRPVAILYLRMISGKRRVLSRPNPTLQNGLQVRLTELFKRSISKPGANQVM